MKRTSITVTLALLLIASLLLGACGEATATSTTAPATTTAPPKTTAPTPAVPSTTAAPTTTAASGKVYNLKFSYHTPPTASLVTTYLKPWTAAIEEATKGQVKITHYGAETLVKAKDQFDGLVSGLSDMALVDTAETPGRFSTTEFDILPFIFPDAATGAKVYWDMLQKYSVAGDLKEVQVIAVTVLAGNNWVGNKPVQNVADFKGLRIRAAGKVESWTIEALGGTPVEIATSDLGTSLERGLVDGAFVSYSLMLSMGLKDVTKYRTECNIQTRAWPIMVNKKAWDSIPADLQKTILSVSGQENSAKYCIDNEKATAGAKNAVIGSDKGQGKGPIYVLTSDQLASWKKALLPVWDRWSADMEGKKMPGKAIIADVQAATTKYSAK